MTWWNIVFLDGFQFGSGQVDFGCSSLLHGTSLVVRKIFKIALFFIKILHVLFPFPHHDVVDALVEVITSEVIITTCAEHFELLLFSIKSLFISGLCSDFENSDIKSATAQIENEACLILITVTALVKAIGQSSRSRFSDNRHDIEASKLTSHLCCIAL